MNGGIISPERLFIEENLDSHVHRFQTFPGSYPVVDLSEASLDLGPERVNIVRLAYFKTTFQKGLLFLTTKITAINQRS